SEKKAKPLLHLKDRPLLSHLVEKLPRELPILISVNRAFAEGIQQWAKIHSDRQIQVVVEDSENDEGKLGALAATAFVIQSQKIDEDLLLMAGDNYFGFSFSDFIAHFKNNPLLAAYDIGSKESARKFGVVVAQDGHVIEFQEKPAQPKSTLISTGCYLFPQKNLTDIVEYSKTHKDNLGGIFEYFLKRGETIDVFRFTEPWYDIGSFDAYLQANSELLAGAVIQEESVILEGNNRLEKGVYLGKGVHVTNSLIDNCIVLDNCVINNCVLRNCVIDEDCYLRGIDLSHQMLRAGSRIEK
ncbi:MAG: NDP-sugar synthase, partial [Candidatus Peregrinibacteria bacterium]